MVEEQTNPLGIEDLSPEFSWEIPPPHEQSSFQILVASSRRTLQLGVGDVWDSGRVEGEDVQGVSYGGKKLKSREKYYWTVRFWNKQGEISSYASSQSFEVGLLEPKDWTSSWIWVDSGAAPSHRYFRTTFDVEDKAIAQARLYVTGMHVFEFYLNKEKVGWPLNFAYPEKLYYEVVDVTEQVKQGSKNVFGVRAHWFGLGQGRPHGMPALRAQLEISYQDGSTQYIQSTKSWRTRDAEWYYKKNDAGLSLTHRNNEGVPQENIDLGGHPHGWLSADYDDTSWRAAQEIPLEVHKEWAEPRAQETRVVEKIIVPKRFDGGESLLFDLGRVYAAYPEVDFPAIDSEDPLTVKLGYRIDEVQRVVPFAQITDLTYEVKPAKKPETFRPAVYLGFRYIELPKLKEAFAGESVRAVARHHEVQEDVSSFSSSDEVLNRIWELVRHSVLYSAQEQFIDTPTREQGQFAYDGYLIGTAHMRLFKERNLNQQALREFAESQSRYNPPDGRIDAAYPNGQAPQDIGDWTMIWLVWLAEYYQETGDTELVRELFPAAERTVKWIFDHIDKKAGLFWADPSTAAAGLVDWPKQYEYDTGIHYRSVMSLNAVEAFSAFSTLANSVGAKKVSERWRKRSQRLFRRLEKLLWDSDKLAFCDGIDLHGKCSEQSSQQTNAFFASLYPRFGFEKRERLEGALAVTEQMPLRTSTVLFRHVISALGESGRESKLLAFLRDPEGPSYAALLADGATFTYEGWDGRRAATEDSESHGFGAFAGVLALQRYVLGIRREEVAFRRFSVRPLPGDLLWAKGCRATAQGKVCVDWRREGKEFVLKVSVPGNSRASVELPSHGSSTLVINGEPYQARSKRGYLVAEDLGPGEYLIRSSLGPVLKQGAG